MLRTLPCHVEGRGRQCKTLQDCARSGKSFLGRVEVWRGGLGSAYRFPTLSVAGASLTEPCSVSTPRSSVGSRADAMLLRSDLSVAPRFLWECLTNRIVSWVSAPAASNVACGFPALRSPVCFSSRVMRPIVLGQLSGEMRFAELDSR